MITTLEDLKKYLGITTTDNDELLLMLIEQATRVIESLTGKKFVEVIGVKEVISGQGEQRVNLKNYPLTDTTVRKLEQSLANTNEEDWKEVDQKNYWVDESAGIIAANFKFIHGFDNYRFTYSYGYKNVPSDIQLAGHIIISSFFNGRGNETISSERIGDYAITYKDITENPIVNRIINLYI